MSQANPINPMNLSRRAALASLSTAAAAGVVALPIAAGLGEAAGLAPLSGLATNVAEPSTLEELAALDYEPIAEFIDFEAVRPAVQRQLRHLYTMATIAVAVCGKTKAQVVKLARSLDADPDSEGAENFVETFGEAREYAETLVQAMTAAEVRLAVALAVTEIEGDGR